MSLLTIDVGLKNLAFCIMGCENKKLLNTYSIHLWEVYNLLQTDYKCNFIQKNGKICNKKCNYKYKNSSTIDNSFIFTCKTHYPKDILLTKRNIYKEKQVKNYSLQELSIIVIDKLHELFNKYKELFDKLTVIHIELQPKFNPKMKFISHVIFSKLAELLRKNEVPVNIKFVGAKFKLKTYTGPEIKCHLKGEYSKRKWLSVQYTNWFLKNEFNETQRDKWLSSLDDNHQVHDKCDTFLMCINGLKF
jgi:hypothetical protein